MKEGFVTAIKGALSSPQINLALLRKKATMIAKSNFSPYDAG